MPLELGSYENPATSCNQISQDRPSGEYWIQPTNTSTRVPVFCETSSRNCSCNSTGAWARVANLDMTDPNQTCPDGLSLLYRTAQPLRTCARPDRGAVSTTFSTHGIEYSRVCGRVVGYQFGHTDGFGPFNVGRHTTIDSCYGEGIILTHGQSPRQHIWTFVAALDEAQTFDTSSCPCIEPEGTFNVEVPSFVGQDYFCDTANPLYNSQPELSELHPDDPLWDGHGCGGTSTCCEFNSPPWFCRHLPEETTNDIELRLCFNERSGWEDTPIEKVEIYIK